MATFTNLYNNYWYFSSNLSDAKGRFTEGDTCAVDLYAFQDVIFSVTIDIHNGNWILYDLRQLCEDYLRKSNTSYCLFTIDLEGENRCEFYVIYSSFKPFYTARYFAHTMFLSRTDVSAIYRDGTTILTYLWAREDGDTSIIYDVLARTPDGRLERYRSQTGGDADLQYVTNMERQLILEWSYLKYIARGNTPCVCNVTITDETNYARRHTIYCIDREADLALTYKNPFNVWETAYLFGEKTELAKSDRETANVGNKRIFYDIQNRRSCKFETTALTKTDSLQLQELVISHDVRLYDYDFSDDPDSQTEIIITEAECEIADSNDELPHINFTYEYATDRHEATIERHLPASPTNIFTRQFDETFA